MCNLYRVQGNTEPLALIALFGEPDPSLHWPQDWVLPFTRPRMPVVAAAFPGGVLASWTLMPPWVKPEDEAAVKKQSRMTANARSETMFDLPSFRDAAKSRRCLVLATEFREWQWQDPRGKVKIPHDIHRDDRQPFLMAGLYAPWGGELTFTIVTKPANALMARIHNGARGPAGRIEPRMPVIVDPEDGQLWLTPGPREAVEFLFIPRDDDHLVAVAEPPQGTLAL